MTNDSTSVASLFWCNLQQNFFVSGLRELANFRTEEDIALTHKSCPSHLWHALLGGIVEMITSLVFEQCVAAHSKLFVACLRKENIASKATCPLCFEVYEMIKKSA